MARQTGSRCIERWPEESRQAARLVIEQHREPDEFSDSPESAAPS